MKELIQDKKFLSKKNIEFIDSIFEKSMFPFYFSKSTKTIKDNKGNWINDSSLCHVILNRKEDRKNGEYSNSVYLHEIIDILNNFTKKHNIKYNEILRAAINFCYNNNQKNCGYHNDHPYDHYQLLMYLNNCDKNAITILKYKNKLLKIKPEKYKAIFFKNTLHKMNYPKKGERIVLIITLR